MFTLLCCADLDGAKVNLEVALSNFPESLTALEDALYHVFQAENAAVTRGSANQTPFRIASVQWYDDEALQWTELLSLDQLHEYDQLYIFQPQSRYHRDTQQDLPPPRPPLLTSSTSAISANESAYPDAADARPVTGHETPRCDDTSFTLHQRADSWRGARGELSPSARKLLEHTREESALGERLRQIRQEKLALERSLATEAEEERRQLAALTDAELKRKEAEIWRQRDRLAQAELDFQALLERKQQLLSANGGRAV